MTYYLNYEELDKIINNIINDTKENKLQWIKITESSIIEFIAYVDDEFEHKLKVVLNRKKKWKKETITVLFDDVELINTKYHNSVQKTLENINVLVCSIDNNIRNYHIAKKHESQKVLEKLYLRS